MLLLDREDMQLENDVKDKGIIDERHGVRGSFLKVGFNFGKGLGDLQI
jgi:hypothetical protein